jgi:hypothetical protein
LDIRKELLKEHSKKQTMKIVKFIGNDPEKFKELMNLFLYDTYRVGQRSAWAVNYCATKHPHLIKPYLNRMIDYLQKSVHVAVKRNTIRLFQFIDIPEKLSGKIANVCFELLQSKDEPVAVKVFSMSVLGKICKTHPDLKNELKLIVEEQLPYSTAGFLSRAKKVFKELKV